MLGNHVMRGDQGQNAKSNGGFKTKVDGDKSTSSGATSTSGLMSSLMSMLNQNPGKLRAERASLLFLLTSSARASRHGRSSRRHAS